MLELLMVLMLMMQRSWCEHWAVVLQSLSSWDVLKWSLCRHSIQHLSSMCYLPMLVFLPCWAVVQNSLLPGGCRACFIGCFLSMCRLVSCHLSRYGNAWWLVSFNYCLTKFFVLVLVESFAAVPTWSISETEMRLQKLKIDTLIRFGQIKSACMFALFPK